MGPPKKSPKIIQKFQVKLPIKVIAKLLLKQGESLAAKVKGHIVSCFCAGAGM